MKQESQENSNEGRKQRSLNIAFLVCDEPAESTLKKHGGFDDMLHNVLEPLIQKEHDYVKLTVQGYDVVEKREYPSSKDLENIDCVCISGSFVEDAYKDAPWISRLCGFMVYLHDQHPGICFGLQILARAFGARVEANDLGWEIGSTELTLTEEGKKILGTPGNPEEKLRIQQVHSDHVTTVPEDFELLASSEKCKIQAIAKYYKDRDTGKDCDSPGYRHGLQKPPKPYCDIHILACQGHPEWGQEVIDPLVDEFLKEGKIDEDLAKAAKDNTKKDDDAEKFARAMLRMLGIALESTFEAKGMSSERAD